MCHDRCHSGPELDQLRYERGRHEALPAPIIELGVYPNITRYFAVPGGDQWRCDDWARAKVFVEETLSVCTDPVRITGYSRLHHDVPERERQYVVDPRYMDWVNIAPESQEHVGGLDRAERLIFEQIEPVVNKLAAKLEEKTMEVEALRAQVDTLSLV